MKKIISILLSGLLIFSLVGCGNSKNTSVNAIKSKEINIDKITLEDAKSMLKKDNVEFNSQNYFSMIKSNDIEKVKLFLKAGMNPNTKFLDSNDKNNYGKTGLIIAVGLGYKDVATALIKGGADINAIDDNSKNALWTVIDNSKYDMIKFLEDNNINVNYIDPKQDSNILYYAVFKNDSKAVKELLNTKVDINYMLDNHNILHLAAAQNTNEDIFKMLVDKGVNINAKDSMGLTPLEMAIGTSHEISVKALVDLGADKTIKNNQGLNAIELAKRTGRTDIINLLK